MSVVSKFSSANRNSNQNQNFNRNNNFFRPTGQRPNFTFEELNNINPIDEEYLNKPSTSFDREFNEELPSAENENFYSQQNSHNQR